MTGQLDRSWLCTGHVESSASKSRCLLSEGALEQDIHMGTVSAFGVTRLLDRAGCVQDMLSREEQEQGRVEVLPVQWRKHLTLEVRSAPSHRCAAAAAAAVAAAVAAANDAAAVFTVVVAAAAVVAAAVVAAGAAAAAITAVAAAAVAAVASLRAHS